MTDLRQITHRRFVTAMFLGCIATSLCATPAWATFACGAVDGKTLKNCQVITQQTTCTPKCAATSVTKVCTSQCSASCTTSADSSCTDACSTDCEKTCTPNPPQFDCTSSCTTNCEASCSGHCKAQCDTTCGEKCAPLPATETCTNKCTTSCGASCTVQANVTCTDACATTCTTTETTSCQNKCTTTTGAIFCDDQFIDADDISKCVAEIQTSGQTVSGAVTVTGSGASSGCTAGAVGTPMSQLAAIGAIFAWLLLWTRKRE